jgi:hypothetical protein
MMMMSSSCEGAQLLEALRWTLNNCDMSEDKVDCVHPLQFEIIERQGCNSSHVLCPFSSETFHFSFELSLKSASFTGVVLNKNSIVAQWVEVHAAHGNSGVPKQQWHDLQALKNGKVIAPTVDNFGSPEADPPVAAAVHWDDDAMAEGHILKKELTLTPSGNFSNKFAEHKIAICFFGASNKGNKDTTSPLGRVFLDLSVRICFFMNFCKL